MPIFKKKIPRKTKIQVAIVATIVLALMVLVGMDVHFNGPLTQLLSNRDDIVQLVRDAKILGPLVYVLLYTVQSVVAPIPGQVVGVVGGYLFGWWGLLWSFIGTAFGFYLVFILARKLGRPFVEKIIKKESLDRFDFLLNKGGGMIFFIVFLIPGLPDDIVGYIAGLSKVPIRKLMWMVLLGRMPALVANNYIGCGMGGTNYWILLVAIVASMALAVFVYVKREAILSWLKGTKETLGKKSGDE